MSDGPDLPGWRFRVLDYVGLGFLLLVAEEVWRNPKAWYSWGGALAIGVVLLWLGDATPIAWKWLLGKWRAPKALTAALMENASLREQLDISRREKAQQESDLWRAQESRRQSDEERRAVLLQIEELKTNSSGQSFLPAPSVQRSLVKPPHNVQCTGFTVFTNDDFITATLCFQNVPNGKLLGKFEMPRLRVIYYDKPTGEELADVYPTEWWSDSGDTPTAVAPFVWTGFSGFKWKDCSVVVVAVGM